MSIHPARSSRACLESLTCLPRVRVLSPAAYNGKVGLALLCPITRRTKGYPFEVPLPDGWPVHGVVLADQVKSLDWRARRAERMGTLPGHLVSDILEKLGLLLAE